MKITEEILADGTIALYHVQGEFWQNEWELETMVRRRTEVGLIRIIVDFSATERINSRGIGVLVSSLASLRRLDGTLKIVGANPRILSILEILQLVTELESFETLEEAVASFD